jgi:hypothetical protein
VVIAALFIMAAKEVAQIMSHLGRVEESDQLLGQAADMAETI